MRPVSLDVSPQHLEEGARGRDRTGRGENRRGAAASWRDRGKGGCCNMNQAPIGGRGHWAGCDPSPSPSSCRLPRP